MVKIKLGQKILSLLTIVALIGMSSYGIFAVLSNTRAAGIDTVVVTLADDSTTTVSQVTVVWTPITALADADIITIYLGENTAGNEWNMNSMLTSDIDCTDTAGLYSGTSVNNATATIPAYVTITADTAGTGEITCTIGDGAGTIDPINPGVADGYEVAVMTNDDAGAGIAYIGDNNDVTVTALVLPLLNLTIDDNTMDLGTVLTTAVATDSHTISVGTNATSGAIVQINADAALNSPGDSWTDVGEATVTAGTEDYGIAFTAGVGWTESGNFASDDSSVPTSATNLMTSVGPIDDSITSTVTYRAAIDATTATGSYDQVVTYTATANF